MKNLLRVINDILPKRIDDKISLFFIILTLSLTFSLTLTISMSVGKPLGSDFWNHLEIAESYARGENALFNEEFMDPNKGPYPPLFHLIFVPFVWLGVAVEFATLLQTFFYPLALFTSVFLVWKKINIRSAAFTAILLFSSIAFFDRSVQVIPQAFDMIFFPLAVYFFLEKKHLPFLISMSIVIYSHGAYSFLLLGSLVLFYLLKWREGSKMIRDMLLVSIPLIILTLFFLPSYMGQTVGINTPQEKFMLESPVFFFEYTGWVPVSLFFVSLIYYFYKRKELDKMDILTIFWFTVLMVMLPIFPDRFCTYAVVPMSIMASRFLMETSSAYGRGFGLVLLVILFLLALPFYLAWWDALSGTGFTRLDIH